MKLTWQATALTMEQDLSSNNTLLSLLYTTICAQFSVWLTLLGWPELQSVLATAPPVEHHLKLVGVDLNP